LGCCLFRRSGFISWVRRFIGLTEVILAFPRQHIRRYGCDQLQAHGIGLFAYHETVDIQGAFIREYQDPPDPVLEFDIPFIFEAQSPFRDIQDFQLLPVKDKPGASTKPVADTGKLPSFRIGFLRGFVIGTFGNIGNVFNNDGYKEENHRYSADKPGKKIWQAKEKGFVQPDDDGTANNAGTGYVQDPGAHEKNPLFRWCGLIDGRTEFKISVKISR